MIFDMSVFDIFNSIKFYSKDHTYKINNNPAALSVTRFLNLFAPDFDRDKIAKNVANKQGVDVQIVINEWEYEKEIACTKGTLLHNYIDNYLNKRIVPLDKNSVDVVIKNNAQKEKFYKDLARTIMHFHSFYEWYSENFIHLKSEFVIGDVQDTLICGTIDNLSLCRKTGQLFIIDYKTNKKFDNKNNFGKTLKYPIQHLEDCKTSVYGLQIAMYSYIIEKYTKIPCKGLLVWFNEKNETYQLFPTQDLKKEIVTMINWYKEDRTPVSTLTADTLDYIMSIT